MCIEGLGGGAAEIGQPGSCLLTETSKSCNILAGKYGDQVCRNLYRSRRVFSSAFTIKSKQYIIEPHTTDAHIILKCLNSEAGLEIKSKLLTNR